MSEEAGNDIDNAQPAAPRRPARPYPGGVAGGDLGQDEAQNFAALPAWGWPNQWK